MILGFQIYEHIIIMGVVCPNFGTPKKLILHLEQMENLLFLGVPT